MAGAGGDRGVCKIEKNGAKNETDITMDVDDIGHPFDGRADRI